MIIVQDINFHKIYWAINLKIKFLYQHKSEVINTYLTEYIQNLCNENYNILLTELKDNLQSRELQSVMD